MAVIALLLLLFRLLWADFMCIRPPSIQILEGIPFMDMNSCCGILRETLFLE